MLEASIIKKLESLKSRSAEIYEALAKEGATDDMANFTQLNKEHAEISPIVDLFKLLQDGISEGVLYGGEVNKIIGRMNLIFADSKNILPKLSPEVVLIDTMYKDRKKTALVKNDMRLVREIVGPDSDYIELIDVALKYAKNRVVIKQPRYAEPLNDIKECSHQILGKTIRYDVHMKT